MYKRPSVYYFNKYINLLAVVASREKSQESGG